MMNIVVASVWLQRTLMVMVLLLTALVSCMYRSVGCSDIDATVFIPRSSLANPLAICFDSADLFLMAFNSWPHLPFIHRQIIEKKSPRPTKQVVHRWSVIRHRDTSPWPANSRIRSPEYLGPFQWARIQRGYKRAWSGKHESITYMNSAIPPGLGFGEKLRLAVYGLSAALGLLTSVDGGIFTMSVSNVREISGDG